MRQGSTSRSKRTRRLALLVLAGALAAACSKSTLSSPTDPVKTCTKEGETCEYSEGKLGVCTLKMGSSCDAGPCYSCMSLH